MTEHLQGYPYSQDVITRLHERAESYRQSSPSAAHTADLLDEAAGCIAALLADLQVYARTAKLIEEVDRRVVEVLMWMDERGRNSRSFGSHADAYEIAARRLREALGAPEPVSFADIADDGPTAA